MKRALFGAALVFLAGCGSPLYVRTTGLGNDSGIPFDVGSSGHTGGAPAVATGGTSGTGGNLATDAGPALDTGGVTGTATGGVAATGGAVGSGGVSSSGGRSGTGGVVATGGVSSSGGTAPATGGRGTGGAIATGGASSSGGAAASGGRGTGGASTGGSTSGSGLYDFESTTQSWGASAGTPAFTSVTRSTTRHFTGASALAAAMTATAPTVYQLAVTPSPSIPPGATITFHLFIPTGAVMDWVQPYAFEGAPNFVWTGMAIPISAASLNAWQTFTVKVPAISGPIAQIGVQFDITGPWTGTVYLDSVTW